LNGVQFKLLVEIKVFFHFFSAKYQF